MIIVHHLDRQQANVGECTALIFRTAEFDGRQAFCARRFAVMIASMGAFSTKRENTNKSVSCEG